MRNLEIVEREWQAILQHQREERESLEAEQMEERNTFFLANRAELLSRPVFDKFRDWHPDCFKIKGLE